MDVRSVLQRALASQAELEADEERTESHKRGCTPVAEVPERRRATVHGVIRSITLRPRQGVPALEAELYDGTGTLDLVWLGRREIAGIEPGRRGTFEGLVCGIDGRRTVYNPRYELQPRPGE
ncbi:OB-fold nucleic acid binding domain-containing protein [Cellulomonas sp. ATA003]|uniref:OB-fold nucleic acid binding domain-containing protein n=1 Tax=Cellulomonas sp. ATA003 TaxID=3073064 RepID=UPI0028730AE9|nr:OB-fold nucleic acid binding domain-containing protein [Cellulomonas sp. ATA003]WNB84436.1 OB-fold nucleic acid binding domain-containing protein [Cellulomonas sp. ATA003]